VPLPDPESNIATPTEPPDIAQLPTIQLDLPRRSTRPRRQPTYLEDFHTAHTTVSKRYPIHNYLSYHSLSSSFQTIISSINSNHEPRSYKEASKSACWQFSMQAKLKALTTNNTWILTPLPSGKKTIGCKWVYKIKHNFDDTIDRHKACLVAKGFTQLEGLDFLDTFALVAKLTTLCLLLTVATTKNWTLKHLDVNNAFLHGDLHEVVYMTPPPGLSLPSSQHVCKLQCFLYGLKQVGRQWYAKLSSFLLSHKYSFFGANHSLFLKYANHKIIVILVYVDDLVLTGDETEEIDVITFALHHHFKIKNLGNLTYFLGLEITRNNIGLNLSQRNYTLDLLQEIGMMEIAPINDSHFPPLFRPRNSP